MGSKVNTHRHILTRTTSLPCIVRTGQLVYRVWLGKVRITSPRFIN